MLCEATGVKQDIYVLQGLNSVNVLYAETNQTTHGTTFILIVIICMRTVAFSATSLWLYVYWSVVNLSRGFGSVTKNLPNKLEKVGRICEKNNFVLSVSICSFSTATCDRACRGSFWSLFYLWATSSKDEDHLGLKAIGATHWFQGEFFQRQSNLLCSVFNQTSCYKWELRSK